MKKKNIFLTGAPSSGKTTAIKRLIPLLPSKANGFYTEEERVDSKRIGFMLHTLDGKTGYLAHQDIQSEFHIRRYGVSIENIEKLAVPAIQPLNDNIIILDEIGKMECFSEKFVQATQKALDSKNLVIGTITLGGDTYIQEVKKRDDIEIIEITPDNRDQIPQRLLWLVLSLLA